MSQDGIETYRPCALSRKGTRPQRGVRVVGGMVGFRSLTRLPFFIGQCASGRRFLLHPPSLTSLTALLSSAALAEGSEGGLFRSKGSLTRNAGWLWEARHASAPCGSL